MSSENDDGQEKKHAPSERKWEEAAQQGNIPKSADLGSVAVVVSGAIALLVGGGEAGQAILDFGAMTWQLRGAQTMDEAAALDLFYNLVTTVAHAVALPLGVAVLCAAAVGMAQSQMQLASEALEWKLDRLDPVQGFQSHYLSLTPLVELGKAVIKLIFIGGVIGWALWDHVFELPALAALGPRAVCAEMVALAWTLLYWAFPVLLAVAAADYGYSYYKLNNDLMMTDQELRDSMKQAEGDPRLKASRRQRARQLAMGTMVQALREADVLVTNPTHFAVALRYKRDRDAAPVVVAKGVDHLALKLRNEALRLGIPRVEDRPLARALHKRVQVGRPIPEDLFGPVARVLAVLYRRRNARMATNA